MEIIDIIEQSRKSGAPTRAVHQLSTIAIHRVGVDLETGVDLGSPPDICRRFIDDPEIAKYTGGQVPYTFMVDRDGTIWQPLSLSDIAPHARRWNHTAVGIACVGDFRHEPPTKAQRFSLEEFCAELVQMLGLNTSAVKGHDELPGGSADPSKRCPGKYLNMDALGLSVAEMIKTTAGLRLMSAGVVL